jgi:antitoxin VapB
MYTCDVYTNGAFMVLARVFQSGNSQAVRLPKEFRVKPGAVEIFRRGDEIVLREIPENALAVLAAFAKFPDDIFAEARVDPAPETRDEF